MKGAIFVAQIERPKQNCKHLAEEISEVIISNKTYFTLYARPQYTNMDFVQHKPW